MNAREAPRAERSARSFAVGSSVGRIPDHGEHVLVVLTGSPTEIGVELLRPESRIGKAQDHIIFAGAFAGLDPPRADLDVMQCTA